MQESGEMYLESIYVLSQSKSEVRSIDVCDFMGFSKPSVSRAMGKLRDDDCIVMDNSGFITLTDKGRDIACKIYERHTLLTKFFKFLGVPDSIAEADACKIEHVLSDETFEALKVHWNENNELAED